MCVHNQSHMQHGNILHVCMCMSIVSPVPYLHSVPCTERKSTHMSALATHKHKNKNNFKTSKNQGNICVQLLSLESYVAYVLLATILLARCLLPIVC